MSVSTKLMAVADGLAAGLTASFFPVLDDRGLGIQRRGPADRPTFVITDEYKGGGQHSDHLAGLGRTTVYGALGALGAAVLSSFVPGLRELDTGSAATLGEKASSRRKRPPQMATRRAATPVISTTEMEVE